jgi:uncharacterized membrane protein
MLGWMTPDMWLGMALWLVLLAVLVWALVREPRRRDGDDALAILRARLARGEISAEEFRRAVDLLNP